MRSCGFGLLAKCFFGWCVSFLMNGGHHGEGQHDKRYVTMPAMPGPRFIMIEAELVFGGLKAVFDRPAMSFNGDQLLDGSSGGTPGGEVGEFVINDMAPDQQAARPQAAALLVELAGVKIGEFEIRPVMQAWPLGPAACRQAAPVHWL